MAQLNNNTTNEKGKHLNYEKKNKKKRLNAKILEYYANGGSLHKFNTVFQQYLDYLISVGTETSTVKRYSVDYDRFFLQSL